MDAHIANQESGTYDVFLSYHGRDRLLAWQVYDYLTAPSQGLRVWFDQTCLRAGELWLSQIERGLNASSTFVVLLTDSPPQNWVEQEVNAAMRGFREGLSPASVIPAVIGGYDLDAKHPNAIGRFLSGFQLARLKTVTATDGVRRVTPEGFRALYDSIRGSQRQPNRKARLLADNENPFQGLEPFQPSRSYLFFGRENEARELVDRLERPSRWVQIEGASGSGKSSLVRAGLIPALTRRPEGPESPQWLTLVMRPGSEPMKSLAAELAKLDREIGGRQKDSILEGKRQTELEQWLARDPPALAAILRQWNADYFPERPRPLLLFVDQFEELFTQDHQSQRGHLGDGSPAPLAGMSDGANDPIPPSEGFTAVLLATLRDSSAPVKLLTTIRSDFLHHVIGHEGLARVLKDAQRYPLCAISPDALRRAIEGPLELAGGDCERNLVDRLVSDALDGPGRLPLLSQVLQLLWQRVTQTSRDRPTLTFADYEALGGVGGAVRQAAETLFEHLTDREKKVARRILLQLVQVGRDARDVRRTRMIDDLVDDDESESVLFRLSGGSGTQDRTPFRVVVVEDDGSVDLLHEVLINDWPRFRSWIDGARRDLQRRDEIEDAARIWENSGSRGEDLPKSNLLRYYDNWETEDPPLLSRDAQRFLRWAKQETLGRERLGWGSLAFFMTALLFFAYDAAWGPGHLLRAGFAAGSVFGLIMFVVWGLQRTSRKNKNFIRTRVDVGAMLAVTWMTIVWATYDAFFGSGTFMRIEALGMVAVAVLAVLVVLYDALFRRGELTRALFD